MRSSSPPNHVTRDMVLDELKNAWEEEQTLLQTRHLLLKELADASLAASRAVSMALAWGMNTEEIAEALETKPSMLRDHLPRRFARERGWQDATYLGPGWKRYWDGKSYTRTRIPTPQARNIVHEKVLGGSTLAPSSLVRLAALFGLLYATATLIPGLPTAAWAATWVVGALLSLIGLRGTRLYAKLAFVGIFISCFSAALLAAQSIF